MRTALSVCLLLGLTAGVAAGGVSWVSEIVLSEPVQRSLLMHVSVGVLSAIAVAAPALWMGKALDRWAAAFRRRVEHLLKGTAEREQTLPPPWLAPVLGGFDEGFAELKKGIDGLRGQLREMEIRHHIAESERRQVEVVLNSLRDAVIVTNPFHEISIANDAAARTLGFDRESALHQAIDKVVSDKSLCRAVKDVREQSTTGEQRHIEHELQVDGEPRVFDVTLSGVKTEGESPAGVVTILHDMTREREISQMKSDFVSKASHELRTPLSSIRGYVELLVDGEAQDEQSRVEFYRVIQSETDRLGRLIDNMLNISRIEAGMAQIDRTQVDLKQLVRRAAETIEPQAAAKSMSVITRCADLSLTAEADEDMIYQVILNLLSNAVKYTPEGGRITVSADSDNLTRSVVVSVADTGLGIPPDALPRLFDKFYRVENFKRVAKGTGLGLNLCKHIVETVHRGQIGVESKLGMGSRFWFSIPMKYAGSQNAA